MSCDLDTIEEWFEDVVSDLPPFALFDLLERCIADLEAEDVGSDLPTLH